MKFSISYKFKLKMAQNLSGRSGPVRAGRCRWYRSGAGRCRSGPVGAGQGRSVPVPVPVPLVPPVPVPTGADRCRPVPTGAGAADRPQETLYLFNLEL